MISISILIGNENFVKGRHKISDKKMEISKKDPALTPAKTDNLKTDNLKTENLKTENLKTGHLKEDFFQDGSPYKTVFFLKISYFSNFHKKRPSTPLTKYPDRVKYTLTPP